MRFPAAFLGLSLSMSCLIASAQVPTAVATQADAPPASLQTVSASQVRIVRLSQVAGQVELDRKTGQKFDVAFVNLPIVAGAALRTQEGVAEVEFEDNSSLRLTPQSQVEFPGLGRSISGSTITTVNLLHGSLYVSLAESKSPADFTVNAGNQTIVLSPSTHLRLDLDAPAARMLVYQGSAIVTGPSGSIVVGRKKAIRFDTASAAAPEFVRIGDVGAYDDWDKNAVDYHKVRTVAAANGFAPAPYSYGVNDLDYYGSFSNVAGCGTMWRPYLASASFDPYASGVWSYYPGQGYSWVSIYPWGWTPYHSGSWNYCPAGGGWGWSPQGNWNGLINRPTWLDSTSLVKSSVRNPAWPTLPSPPVLGGATLIPVNVKSLQVSQQGADGKFVFRNDSAGLGIPRGVFNNLAKISQTASVYGSATTYLSEHQMQVGSMGLDQFLSNRPSSNAWSANRTSTSISHTGSTVSISSPSFSSIHASASSATSSASSASGSHH